MVHTVLPLHNPLNRLVPLARRLGSRVVRRGQLSLVVLYVRRRLRLQHRLCRLARLERLLTLHRRQLFLTEEPLQRTKLFSLRRQGCIQPHLFRFATCQFGLFVFQGCLQRALPAPGLCNRIGQLRLPNLETMHLLSECDLLVGQYRLLSLQCRLFSLALLEHFLHLGLFGAEAFLALLFYLTLRRQFHIQPGLVLLAALQFSYKCRLALLARLDRCVLFVEGCLICGKHCTEHLPLLVAIDQLCFEPRDLDTGAFELRTARLGEVRLLVALNLYRLQGRLCTVELLPEGSDRIEPLGGYGFRLCEIPCLLLDGPENEVRDSLGPSLATLGRLQVRFELAKHLEQLGSPRLAFCVFGHIGPLVLEKLAQNRLGDVATDDGFANDRCLEEQAQRRDERREVGGGVALERLGLGLERTHESRANATDRLRRVQPRRGEREALVQPIGGRVCGRRRPQRGHARLQVGGIVGAEHEAALEHALRRRLFLVEHVRLQRDRNALLFIRVVELKPRVQLVHASVHKGRIRLRLGGGCAHWVRARAPKRYFFVTHTHTHTDDQTGRLTHTLRRNGYPHKRSALTRA